MEHHRDEFTDDDYCVTEILLFLKEGEPAPRIHEKDSICVETLMKMHKIPQKSRFSLGTIASETKEEGTRPGIGKDNTEPIILEIQCDTRVSLAEKRENLRMPNEALKQTMQKESEELRSKETTKYNEGSEEEEGLEEEEEEDDDEDFGSNESEVSKRQCTSSRTNRNCPLKKEMDDGPDPPPPMPEMS